MKTIIKIIIWSIVLLLIVFFALGIYISLLGKEMLITQLEERLNMPVQLEGISLHLPLSLNLKKLQVADLIKVREISFTPVLPALFSGRIVIDDLKLIDPVVELIKYADGSLNFSLAEQKGRDWQFPLKLIISGLRVEGAKLSYLDKSISSDGVTTILDQLNLDIFKTFFPLSRINLNFRLSSAITDAEGKKLGGLSGEGWINLLKRSAQAGLSIENLDIAYFEPYYGDFISKRKLLSARLNLNSRAEAEDNDLEIVSRLGLSDLVYESGDHAPEAGQLDIDAVIAKALDLFIDDSGNLELNFTINTKLDQPKVNVGQIKQAVISAALENLMAQPPNRIIEKFESIVGRFKDFGQQIEGVFKRKDPGQ